MDRLRVMTGARRMFNGPLHKCSKASAGHCRTSPSWTAAVRMFGATSSRSTPSSSTGQIILESPFGTVNPVDVTLPEYIWRNVDKWEDKPMIVSTYNWLYLLITASRHKTFIAYICTMKAVNVLPQCN